MVESPSITYRSIVNKLPSYRYMQGVSWLSILLFIVGLSALALSWFWYASNKPAEVEVISREGVIAKIQALNRLQTVGFSVDTVITSHKQGNWYNLWQDEQKGLFVAHGQVLAGIDLNKLTPEQVQVSQKVVDNQNLDDNQAQDNQGDLIADISNLLSAPKQPQTVQVITITIPPAEIFDVYIEDIEVYDLQTGLFGMLKTDPAIFESAQDVGKSQVLKTACEGNVLQMATDNAQKQVEGLFSLTGFEVIVVTQAPIGCK